MQIFETGLGSAMKSAFPAVFKVSGIISTSMAVFDLAVFGAGLLDQNNAFTTFNQRLHSNSLYNAFQFTVSAWAVFTGSFNHATQNPTCFVAGTMVLTTVGLVAIEQIKAGDKVISTVPETLNQHFKSNQKFKV